jgi:hypothetical protein
MVADPAVRPPETAIPEQNMLPVDVTVAPTIGPVAVTEEGTWGRPAVDTWMAPRPGVATPIEVSPVTARIPIRPFKFVTPTMAPPASLGAKKLVERLANVLDGRDMLY